ncbi:MAG: NCS2 family permease [Bacteroidales bacterium]|nr:NCS2 family permease [Bacteroidales bacterium]
MLSRFFELKKNKTSYSTEIIAGLTTFMTMAYILAVNPNILSETGMHKGALFTATALASCIATLIMAFVARLPYALAPGMGLNAFFAYTVVIGMGYSWQTALMAVFLEGIIFIILTLFNIREAIVNSIPLPIKHAISVGIGLFIALMGFENAELIISDPNTLLTLGSMDNHMTWVALAGLLTISVLLILRVKGAVLIGIVVATAIGIPLGVTTLPEKNIVTLPAGLGPIFFKMDFHGILKPDILVVLFTFLFIDMFDTVGTLIGVSSKANLLDRNGKVPRAKQALLADSIGTTVGAMLGTSTVTTYVESTAGIAVGGKTGLTALIVAICFLLVLFISPVFLMIPAAATAPALIIIGLFMISPITKIDLENYLDAIPVFLTIIMMPLAFSISEGISFGIISYVAIRILSGKWKKLSPVLVILAILFVVRYFF